MSAETRAQARARLWAMANPPQPRRRYRRRYHVVVWVPLIVVFPLVAVALPFLMIGLAAKVFRRVFLDPRTIAFAGFVVAVIAELAIEMHAAAVSLARQAEQTWQESQHHGEHEHHQDPLDQHFPPAGRW